MPYLRTEPEKPWHEFVSRYGVTMTRNADGYKWIEKDGTLAPVEFPNGAPPDAALEQNNPDGR